MQKSRGSYTKCDNYIVLRHPEAVAEGSSDAELDPSLRSGGHSYNKDDEYMGLSRYDHNIVQEVFCSRR